VAEQNPQRAARPGKGTLQVAEAKACGAVALVGCHDAVEPRNRDVRRLQMDGGAPDGRPERSNPPAGRSTLLGMTQMPS
jgi:hypothetical protein